MATADLFMRLTKLDSRRTIHRPRPDWHPPATMAPMTAHPPHHSAPAGTGAYSPYASPAPRPFRAPQPAFFAGGTVGMAVLILTDRAPFDGLALLFCAAGLVCVAVYARRADPRRRPVLFALLMLGTAAFAVAIAATFRVLPLPSHAGTAWALIIAALQTMTAALLSAEARAVPRILPSATLSGAAFALFGLAIDPLLRYRMTEGGLLFAGGVLLAGLAVALGRAGREPGNHRVHGLVAIALAALCTLYGVAALIDSDRWEPPWALVAVLGAGVGGLAYGVGVLLHGRRLTWALHAFAAVVLFSGAIASMRLDQWTPCMTTGTFAVLAVGAALGSVRVPWDAPRGTP